MLTLQSAARVRLVAVSAQHRTWSVKDIFGRLVDGGGLMHHRKLLLTRAGVSFELGAAASVKSLDSIPNDRDGAPHNVFVRCNTDHSP